MEGTSQKILDKVAEISDSMIKLQSEIDFVRVRYSHVPKIQEELESAQKVVDKNQRLLVQFLENSLVMS
jgi:hypothetical protein